MSMNTRGIGMKNRIKDKPSTNIPTESNPSGGVRNQNDPTSYPSGAEIKSPDVPTKPSTGDKELKEPKIKLKSITSSYDPTVEAAVQVLDELSKKTLNQYTYDAAQSRGREKGIKMAAKKLGKYKSARTVRKQKEDEDKGREVGHSRQELSLIHI